MLTSHIMTTATTYNQPSRNSWLSLDKHAPAITKLSQGKSQSNPCFTATLWAFKSSGGASYRQGSGPYHFRSGPTSGPTSRLQEDKKV